MIRASAPGKLLVLGDYAVLEGAPAVVMAVERRAVVTLTPRGADRGWTVCAPDLGLPETDLGRDAAGRPCLPTGRAELAALGLVTAVLGAAVGARHGGRLTIETSALRGPDGVKLGLGSSAAVSVATYAAGAKMAGTTGDVVRLREAVRDVHRRHQGGVGSGVDVVASVHGGLTQWVDQRAVPMRLPEGIAWRALWTGQAASTASLVSRVLGACKERPEAAQALRTLTELARVGAGLFADAAALVELLGRYGDAMVRLGEVSEVEIATPRHRALMQAARTGGVAYKPSGAGGGDVGLAVSTNGAALEAFMAEARRQGCLPLELELAAGGVEVADR